MSEQVGWRETTGRPELEEGEVHVWRAVLTLPEEQIRQLERDLDEQERERAARFHFAKDRRAFVASRAALRRLVGAHQGVPPTQVRFAYTARGKPFCQPLPGRPPLCFNLSHSGDLALCAVTLRRAVGVDVERLRPVVDWRQVAQRFFSPREYQALLSAAEPERTAMFFRIWTRKEAYIKGLGEGLARPLQQFDVSWSEEEPARLLADRQDPTAAARWRLAMLHPGQGYAAAVAVEGGFARLCCWQWPPVTD